MHLLDIGLFPVIATDGLQPLQGRVPPMTRVVHPHRIHACAYRDRATPEWVLYVGMLYYGYTRTVCCVEQHAINLKGKLNPSSLFQMTARFKT